MSGARLGGGSREPVNYCENVSKLHVHVLPDMATALKQAKRHFWKGHSPKDTRRFEYIGERPVGGDATRLKAAQSKSEQLVEEALAYDPRLARKAQWLRRDEGEHVCAAAIAEGDDQPFYKRIRTVVNDATTSGEPLRVVISTDDNKVIPHTAAAFIAVSRLVQQFMPIEVWWQGAWLTEDRSKGFVFMVPLIRGDMDFSRLEFCIADPARDSFSYLVMASHAVLDLKEGWNNCATRADDAYHPTERDWKGNGRCDYSTTTKFISHHGIEATERSVANTAASWLGWESCDSARWSEMAASSSAAQEIRPESVYTPDPNYKGPSAADRERWAQQDRDAKAKALKEAKERMVEV